MQDALSMLQYLWTGSGYDTWQQWSAKINTDGVTDAWDAQLILQYMIDQGGVTPPPDLDSDGLRNILDVAIGQGYPQETIGTWFHEVVYGALADGAGPVPAPSRVVAKETALGQNYPNPFNPETWIPYQLSEDAGVVIKIYTATGQLVRELSLGHKPAGFYLNRDRAAYWDGQNETGEGVSSGVYFYTIRAGDFTATKKMIVVK